jgi:hypothetical protein
VALLKSVRLYSIRTRAVALLKLVRLLIMTLPTTWPTNWPRLGKRAVSHPSMSLGQLTQVGIPVLVPAKTALSHRRR